MPSAPSPVARSRPPVVIPLELNHPVLCENSAEAGLLDNRRRSPRSPEAYGPGTRSNLVALISNLARLALGQPLGHACAMDSLPPPFAFIVLLFAGWVNRQQQTVIDLCLVKRPFLLQ